MDKSFYFRLLPYGILEVEFNEDPFSIWCYVYESEEAMNSGDYDEAFDFEPGDGLYNFGEESGALSVALECMNSCQMDMASDYTELDVFMKTLTDTQLKTIYKHALDHNSLLGSASDVVLVSEGGFTPHKMRVRTEYIIDRLLAESNDESEDYAFLVLWNGSTNATKNCVDYFIKSGGDQTKLINA